MFLNTLVSRSHNWRSPQRGVKRKCRAIDLVTKLSQDSRSSSACNLRFMETVPQNPNLNGLRPSNFLPGEGIGALKNCVTLI
ncbi:MULTISPECIES: hypothetical protein [unclassified Microcoleus]|uniref:hypothetical protein n=1 Tax=unclassified Microcoleus TaxID=2642155 RepID=UPI002FD4C774